jgi:DNA-binding response OmpR family regulator
MPLPTRSRVPAGCLPMADADPPHRILLVEDDAMIAMLVADQCDALGYGEPVHAATVADALAAVARGGIGAALLDVNVGDEAVWPVADALVAAAVPFVLMTGGGGRVPRSHIHVPTLTKPFRIAQLDSVLSRMIRT